MRVCRYLTLNNRFGVRHCFCLVLLFIAAQACLAETRIKDNLSWHGFISQGYVYTSNNEFFGSSSDGSLDFNEAGINAAWQANSKLLLSGQLLYRRAGETKPMGTRVDYAIVDWRLFDDMDASAGLRAGRLKTPYGFYSETRDVAATRPGILLPEGIYTDNQRELIHSMDSLGGYGFYGLDTGTVTFEANYGKPIFNDDTTKTILNGLPTQGDLTNERAFVSRIGYEQNNGEWRTAFSGATFSTDFEPAAGEPFPSGNVSADQLLASFEYNWQSWQFVGEYMWRNIHYENIFGPELVYRGIAYYAQANYRISDQLSVYARREESFLDKNDKDGEKFAAASGFTRPAHNAFAKDSAIGARFQPDANWTIGLEYHRINGTAWLPMAENPDPSKQKQHWEMFLFQAAYRF